MKALIIQAAGLPAILVSIMAITACDRSDGASAATAPALDAGPSRALPNPFDAELSALKTRERDQAKLEDSIHELVRSYGFVTRDRASSPEPGVAASLGKTAAAQAAIQWYRAKTFHYGDEFTIEETMTIPIGGTLDIRTTHESGLDPYVVAFVLPSDPSHAMITTFPVLGVSDDEGGNLDAHFVWTNRTGLERNVTFVACAFLPEVAGMGTVTAECTAGGASCGEFTRRHWMSGFAVRSNLTGIVPAGCSGPFQSKISQSGSDILMAVNNLTKRGGMIRWADADLVLDDVLTEDTHNFLLAYRRAPKPGVKLVFESYLYTGVQRDKYSCP